VECLILTWLFLCGPLGGWVAGQKGRSGAEGFALGFVFGPFGVLVEALLPSISAEELRYRAEMKARIRASDQARREAERGR
jgi:hypothetical protein